jgi:hypothetical protein
MPYPCCVVVGDRRRNSCSWRPLSRFGLGAPSLRTRGASPGFFPPARRNQSHGSCQRSISSRTPVCKVAPSSLVGLPTPALLRNSNRSSRKILTWRSFERGRISTSGISESLACGLDGRRLIFRPSPDGPQSRIESSRPTPELPRRRLACRGSRPGRAGSSAACRLVVFVADQANVEIDDKLLTSGSMRAARRRMSLLIPRFS